MTIAFETRYYVYGVEVKGMTDGQLIAAIKRVEGEISDLRSIAASSSKIAIQIAEKQQALTCIVAHLDSRVK